MSKWNGKKALHSKTYTQRRPFWARNSLSPHSHSNQLVMIWSAFVHSRCLRWWCLQASRPVDTTWFCAFGKMQPTYLVPPATIIEPFFLVECVHWRETHFALLFWVRLISPKRPHNTTATARARSNRPSQVLQLQVTAKGPHKTSLLSERECLSNKR